MPLIHVIDQNGVEHRLEATSGRKVMELLRDIDCGVAAICGGMCSCATCHVYIAPEWLQRLPDATPDERELLLELSHLKSESRLSCQIDFTAALDGLRVTVAPDE